MEDDMRQHQMILSKISLRMAVVTSRNMSEN